MSSPIIQIVVAYSQNRVIGCEGELPWRLPSDLAHFKRVTMGYPIIMGRKTWESIGRPLPGRANLVISRQPDLVLPGATVYADLGAALKACDNVERVSVIGGEQIFALALPAANEIIATEIHAKVSGDTWFPELDASQWTEINRQPQPPENSLSFDYVWYRKH